MKMDDYYLFNGTIKQLGQESVKAMYIKARLTTNPNEIHDSL
jgi:hypothetical protein